METKKKRFEPCPSLNDHPRLMTKKIAACSCYYYYYDGWLMLLIIVATFITQHKHPTWISSVYHVVQVLLLAEQHQSLDE